MRTTYIVTGICSALLVVTSSAWAKPPNPATPSAKKKPGAPPAKSAPAGAAPHVAAPQPLPEAEFKKFEPPGEGFSVMIPKDATTERPKDDLGNEVPGLWSVNGSIGENNFVFFRQSLSPQERAKVGSNEGFYSQTYSMLSEGISGTLKSKTPIKYKGADAEEFFISGTKAHVVGRTVIAGDVLYNLFVFYEAAPPAFVKAYFDSLEFQSAPANPGETTPPAGPNK